MVMVVSLIGLAVIAGVWFFHFRSANKAAASAGWPTAQGTVQASTVQDKLETDSEGDNERAYYPNVHYSWTANGQSRTSDRIAFGGKPRFTRAADAQAVCDRYPQGAAVTVRYNPAKPDEAVLESKKPGLWTPILFTVVVLIFTIIAAAFVAPS